MTDALDHPGPTSASQTPAAVIHLPDLRQRTKKVTSGSENRQRTPAIRVRVHPADAERLKAEAAAAGTSVAGYLASGRLGDEAAPRPRIRRRAPVDVTGFDAGLVDVQPGRQPAEPDGPRARTHWRCWRGTLGPGRVADEVRELRRDGRAIERQFAVADCGDSGGAEP